MSSLGRKTDRPSRPTLESWRMYFSNPGAEGPDRASDGVTEPGPGVRTDRLQALGMLFKSGHRRVGHGQGKAFEFYRRTTQADFNASNLCHFCQGFENKDVPLACESKLCEQRLIENKDRGEVWVRSESGVVIAKGLSREPDRLGDTFIPDARGAKKFQVSRRGKAFEFRQSRPFFQRALFVM